MAAGIAPDHVAPSIYEFDEYSGFFRVSACAFHDSYLQQSIGIISIMGQGDPVSGTQSLGERLSHTLT